MKKLMIYIVVLMTANVWAMDDVWEGLEDLVDVESIQYDPNTTGITDNAPVAAIGLGGLVPGTRGVLPKPDTLEELLDVDGRRDNQVIAYGANSAIANNDPAEPMSIVQNNDQEPVSGRKKRKRDQLTASHDSSDDAEKPEAKKAKKGKYEWSCKRCGDLLTANTAITQFMGNIKRHSTQKCSKKITIEQYEREEKDQIKAALDELCHNKEQYQWHCWLCHNAITSNTTMAVLRTNIKRHVTQRCESKITIEQYEREGKDKIQEELKKLYPQAFKPHHLSQLRRYWWECFNCKGTLSSNKSRADLLNSSIKRHLTQKCKLKTITAEEFEAKREELREAIKENDVE